MSLPEILKPFKEEAKKLLALSPPKDAEFAQGAYQVEILDPPTGQLIWTFLQVDDLGLLHDSFCPICDSEEEKCVHIAASYLWIIGKSGEPLHMLYLHSFWRALFQLAEDCFHEDPDLFIISPKNELKAKNESSSCRFYFQPLSDEGTKLIEEVFKNRASLQEGSLSYLSLTEEERLLWQEGKINEKQRFEFSFWNDFGKRCFLEQIENKKYEVIFVERQNELPHQIEAIFQSFRFRFEFPMEKLSSIIPSLKTVSASLQVFIEEEEERLIHAWYDEKEGVLHLPYKAKEENKIGKNETFVIGDFAYTPNVGFFPRSLKSENKDKRIDGEAIGQFLDEYLFKLGREFGGFPLDKKPVHLKFDLKFDDSWNLDIEPYLFEMKDLSLPFSKLFGDWAFIQGKGFFKLDKKSLEKLPKKIPEEEISAFITKYKSFLNEMPGFHIFVSSLEEMLAYTVDKSGRLTFGAKLLFHAGTLKTKEFGNYLYIEGQGFYQKKPQTAPLSIRPGLSLSKEQVPLFIKERREELKLIPHFFTQFPPITKSWMELKIETPETLELKPHFELAKDLSWQQVILYDDVVYVKDKGFYELPPHLRLPDSYKQDLKIPKEKVLSFLQNELAGLKRVIPYYDDRIKKPSLIKAFIKQINKEGGQYGLSIYYQTEYGEVALREILEALFQKKDFIFSNAGLINLREINYRWLKSLKKKQIDPRKNRILLSPLDFYKVDAFLDLELKVDPQDLKKSQEILDELRSFRPHLMPNLSELKSQLRPYQETGVFWLFFLYLHGLSGLLCDDMGLGKTHQSMGLISAIFSLNKENSKPKPKILIVCPTSVMYHWREKLNEFMPVIKVFSYHGQKRALKDFEGHDIFLTTYGILRSDIKEISKIAFDLLICDEIQIAKNSISRVHQALISINAFMRLGLTGTPIENNLSELRALFEIVLPGYMPGEKEYKEYFQKAIEKENDDNRKKTLRRLIHPFVLRRIKKEVLEDLPEKTEEVSHCDLTDKQLVLYNEVLSKSREKILHEIDNYSKPVPLVHIFALLTHLKQICDHPAVFLKKPFLYNEFESGKWNLFIELLSEALESGQKVVVFSQYLAMLDIMELYLQEKGIGFASLRGATLQRGREVSRFNKDPECKVFLASLLAGGLGIDLTAASIVIHYDRWWNAAKENQATDRVHRYGQTRGVQVFKLVTKNTFEERIDAIIKKKAALLSEVIIQEDFRFMKEFDRSDLKALLEFASIDS